jgi:hypothetical protein
VTTDTIFGILALDYPTMSDDDFRQIQLGELDVLPDGKSVAKYIEQVEELKAAAREEESLDREIFIESVEAERQETQQEKAEDEKVEEPVDEDEDEA